MSLDLVIKNCRTLQGTIDIGIKNGKIALLSGDLREGCERVDAKNLFVMQGAIDAHVHFDDPGYTDREDFEHGSKSAIAGGVTCVIDMPCTSLPPVTTLEALKGKLSAIEGKAFCDFSLFGGIEGSDEDFLKHIRALENYVAGFKCYDSSSMEGFKRISGGKMFEALKASGRPILLHAEDNEIVEHFTHRYADSTDPLDWQRARPAIAEALSIRSASFLAESAKGSLHTVHVSSREGAMAVEEGKKRTSMTAETCPQYLLLNDEHLRSLGTIAKTSPPVRKREDNAFLWKSLRDGVMDFVASDHAPCKKEEKEKNFFEAYSGIPGVQTLLPLMISEGVNKKRINIERAVEILSTAPAKRYGLYPGKGSLSIGADADLVIIDLKKEWILRNEGLFSKNGLSPFDGREMRGRVEKTFLRGELVYDGEPIIKKGRFMI